MKKNIDQLVNRFLKDIPKIIDWLDDNFIRKK